VRENQGAASVSLSLSGLFTRLTELGSFAKCLAEKIRNFDIVVGITAPLIALGRAAL